MVKKIINIGVEGNDASGDPIREAFNKVNENFNELYAIFGQGGGISITNLTDGPDQVDPNSILIANAIGTKYLSKTLEGQGVTIDNTDPTKIVFTAATSKLISDHSPALFTDMDASGFNIFRLGNPDQLVANAQTGGSLDSFAINKGYADNRYVNVSGDSMTGPLRVPSGATGTQVPQKQEVVGRAGGTDNQMTGPLLLYHTIQETDDPLTASTKEYVDLSSFYSKIDLYVSTKGDDNQFNTPQDRKGRSYAYAFKTINAAARFGKILIDNSPWNVGPYVKTITYGNGAHNSIVNSITQVGNLYNLYVTNDGTQTDARDGNNILPGQIIKGMISGAVAFIDSIGVLSSIDGQPVELYVVEYSSLNNGTTFTVGEPLQWSDPIKDLQLTIFVESGNYYEHYPIRVPPNTSIVGDELRRVIVRPKYGRSASPAIDTYFRRDTIFDNNLTIATQNYGWHYLTDSTKSIYSGTLTNPGAFQNAATLVIENRQFIVEEVIGYINQVWKGLDYNQTKCARDTGLIIDALAWDMALQSNFVSIKAAEAYFRGVQAGIVLGAEKAATLDSLDELKTLLLAFVTGDLSRSSITNNITMMKSIISGGLANVPAIVWPNPGNINNGFANAKTIIFNNRTFFQYETLAYLQLHYPNLVYSTEECIRDVGFIVDAVVYDLTYGGNSQSIFAGNAYFLNTNFTINSYEAGPVYDTYNYLKNIVYQVAAGNGFTVLQTNVPKVGGIAGSSEAAIRAQTLVEDIRIIIHGDTPPATAYPNLGALGVGSEFTTNFNSVTVTNKAATITNVINYINNNYFLYDSTLCRRDLGLIVDAVAFDLIYGGNYRSLEAGNSYFQSASALKVIDNVTNVIATANPPITELEITVAGVTYLGTITSRVLQNLAPLHSYQNSYTGNVIQITDPTLVYETTSDVTVIQLTTLITNIMSQDPTVNPTKQNDQLDVFLVNNANIIRDITCQGHGGFMVVLDPTGQVSSKSPYIHHCSSFSKSINSKTFAGGMFVDGFAGNLQAQVTNRLSSTQFNVSGLNVRKPLTPCGFYITGIRFEVDTVSNYDQTLGTALITLSPTTPDTSSYTGYAFNLITVPETIEFLAPGNNSMCSADFTQLNDLGYGVAAVNLGLIEAVSVFSYYAQAGYYADTGAQIRSANGSCAHGAYALIAAGASPLEIPDGISLKYDMAVSAYIYSPDDYYGNVTATSITGSGSTASFKIRVSSTGYFVTLNVAGTGYGAGNILKIYGTQFGGATPANDLTITVSTVSGGSITGFTSSGTVPTGAPFNTYVNHAGDLVFYIDGLSTDYVPVNNSEVEIIHGTSPQRYIYRYSISNAQVVSDTSAPRSYSKTLYRMILSSIGLSASGYQGLKTAVADGTKITIRQNGSLWLQGIAKRTATRPSTALILYENSALYASQTSDYVYRIISFANIADQTGTFAWYAYSNTVIVTSITHGLSTGQVINMTFTDGNNGNPIAGFYTVTKLTNDTFTVIVQNQISSESDGNVTYSPNTEQAQAALKENFRSVVITSYFDANVQKYQPYNVLISSVLSNTFISPSTANLQVGMPLKFNGSLGGITAGTTYYVKSIISVTQFSISSTPTGGTLALTAFTGGTLTATATVATSNTITVSGATGVLYTGQVVRFSGVVPYGLFADKPYYVLSGFTNTSFQVSTTLGGTAVTLISAPCNAVVTPEPMYGTTDVYSSSTTGTVGSITGTGPWNATITGMTATTGLQAGMYLTSIGGTGSLGSGGTNVITLVTSNSVSITVTGGTTPIAGTVKVSYNIGSNYYTWGVTGSYRIAVRDISSYDVNRMNYAISNTKYLLFGWQGGVHYITNYVPKSTSGLPYSYIEIDNLGSLNSSLGLRASIGETEGGFNNTPNFKAVLPSNSIGDITVNISTLRATNHDMLAVGTGSYSTTNFPNTVYGDPDLAIDQAAEVREQGKGRVFYVTSDQDGNFRVGSYFKVDQGTGTVTFAASIAISNLDGLGFKRGVAIAEFSVDDTLADNATDIIPVQQAIRSYIDRRLGISYNNSPLATATLLPTTSSGFMCLDGQLSMKAPMNLGSYQIKNVADPSSLSDAATKVYVDAFLRRSSGTRIGVDGFQMSPILFTSTNGTISNVLATGTYGGAPYTATISGLTSNATSLIAGLTVTATSGPVGVGSLGTGVVTITSIISSTTITVSSTNTITAGPITNIVTTGGVIDMNGNNIIDLANPNNPQDAATKYYVDYVASLQNELREMGGVSLPNPITNVAQNSIFAYDGTNWTYGTQAGDVLFTLSSNTFTSAIQTGKIYNSMVNNSAAIAQSKLNMTLASTYSTAPSGTTAQIQAASGLASFSSSYFTASNGYISLGANVITAGTLAQMPTNTVIGNSSAITNTPSYLAFSTIVQTGGALYQSQFSSNGAVVRTGVSSYTTVALDTAATLGTIVQRDPTTGGFNATTINATTQFNLGGYKVFGNSGSAPNQIVEMYNPQGSLTLTADQYNGSLGASTPRIKVFGDFVMTGTTATINGNQIWHAGNLSAQSSANTASTLVLRDTSGNFAANVITCNGLSIGAGGGGGNSLGTISSGIWQGSVIGTSYGGTGLSTFGGANNAIYSTSASVLTAGTLPVAAGGTGQTSFTNGQVLIGNAAGSLTKTTITAGSGISVTNGDGSITIASTYSPPQALGTSDNVQFNSIGVGTGAPGGGAIRATGDITAFYSDLRLKTNITKINDALGKVKQLSGVSYIGNDLAESFGYTDKSEQVGVLAQDVEKVLPQVVTLAPFDTEYVDGNEVSKSGEWYKTVKYEKLVPLLIEAIKDLSDELENVKKELNDIKNNNSK